MKCPWLFTLKSFPSLQHHSNFVINFVNKRIQFRQVTSHFSKNFYTHVLACIRYYSLRVGIIRKIFYLFLNEFYSEKTAIKVFMTQFADNQIRAIQRKFVWIHFLRRYFLNFADAEIGCS